MQLANLIVSRRIFGDWNECEILDESEACGSESVGGNVFFGKELH